MLGVLTLPVLLAAPADGARLRAMASPGATPFPSVAFAVSCAPSHQAPDDPIMAPGLPGSSHRHAFFGNTSTAASSTVASMAAAPTTCSDPADRAGYWVPTPIGARWTRLRAYYDAGALPPATVMAPPRGLMMVAGNPDAYRPVGIGTVAWSCGRSISGPGWQDLPPRCPAGSSLRARLTFPQCWDGVLPTAGPADVVAAVAATATRAATCPGGHTHRLVRLRLLLEADGSVHALSSGDVLGLHADFWNVWQPDRLGELTAWCVRGERPTNRLVAQCRPVSGAPAFG